MQFISTLLSSRAIEWSLKILTIIVTETYNLWKSMRLMSKRNASGSFSSRLNLGEDGGGWLEGFEDSREETQFLRSWSSEIRIEFDSLKRICILIWSFNSLSLTLSWLISYFNSLIIIAFERLDPCP